MFKYGIIDIMKKTLICDLDETLIHSFYDGSKDLSYDLQLKFSDGTIINTKYRPYLKEFIKYIENNFNIIIWTSASRDYASEIVNKLFKKDTILITENEYDKYYYIRAFHLDDMINSPANIRDIIRSLIYWKRNPSDYIDEKIKIKPIKYILKNIDSSLDLKDIIAIDDDPYKFYQNYGNYWHIPSFEGDEYDSYLLKFIDLLNELKDLDDVRVKKDKYLKLIR